MNRQLQILTFSFFKFRIYSNISSLDMQLGEQTYMRSKDKITSKLTDKQTIQVKVSLEITTQ